MGLILCGFECGVVLTVVIQPKRRLSFKNVEMISDDKMLSSYDRQDLAKPLADSDLPAYIHLNSGALASTPNAPPGNTNGPRARFFVPKRPYQRSRCLT